MREMDVQEFVRRLKTILADQPDSRFAFFLGAGCSLSSGIPTAGQIVKNDWLPKLKKIKTGNDTGVEEWAKSDLKKEEIAYDPSNAALSYGDIIEHLFLTPQSRQAEIGRLTLGKDPGYGYAVLAQLVSHKEYGGCCNFVLTTNFDDMIPDAFYLYSNKKPLVIVHDSLVGFVKISSPRPVVIKLHGDARLAPRNTGAETERLNEQVAGVIRNLLTERGVIFIGYGGNDKSIAEILDGLPSEALPHGVWWINNQTPAGSFGEWLEKRSAIWVKHLDFDELMLLIWAEFNFDHPDHKRFEKIMGDYWKTFESLKKKIEEKPEEEKKKFERAIEDVVAKATDWWTVQLEASKFWNSNPDRAEAIYQEGIDKFPKSAPLLCNCANFFYKIRKNYDRAEEFWKKSLQENPREPVCLGNYAVLLNNIRKDHDQAEEYFQRAVEADPNHANNLGNYANFFYKIRKDYDRAEEYYKKAIEADPNHANNLGSYAKFLKNVRRDYDRSGEFYKRAVEADPNDPKHLSNYAIFLKDVRKDYDGAEEFYKRVLAADPNKVNSLGNYAGFLLAKGAKEDGFKLLTKALDLADEENSSLLIECLFYRYAHSGDEHVLQETLSRIKTMLKAGMRSPGWNLDDNVKRGIEEGHPDPEFLRSLAGVITEREDIKVLDGFKAWEEVNGLSVR